MGNTARHNPQNLAAESQRRFAALGRTTNRKHAMERGSPEPRAQTTKTPVPISLCQAQRPRKCLWGGGKLACAHGGSRTFISPVLASPDGDPRQADGGGWGVLRYPNMGLNMMLMTR